MSNIVPFPSNIPVLTVAEIPTRELEVDCIELGSSGVAIRYDGKAWVEAARLVGIPVIKIDGEHYLHVKEFDLYTNARLAVYQAISLGDIQPALAPILSRPDIQEIAAKTFGLYLFKGAMRKIEAGF